MELRADMPEHHSLISLLNDNGYHTSYFCGYDSHFDFIDVFLERQNIDQIHDISGFDSEYTKMDAIEGGFTWGYSDQDLFNQSFKILDAQPATNPRLDIYFTLNLHEPFIIPGKQSYLQRVETRMPKLDLSAEQQEIYSNYKEVFASLLYTDEAIQNFINEYKKRPEYENTIFVITGDHRLIPIPHRSKIDRYRVFFAIHSPLLNTSEHFASVSTHFNVTPTLLGYLQKNHNLSLPEKTHWIGNTIDTARTFRNVHSIPLMRNKNQLLDYLHEDHFLAENQLFKLHEGLGISPINSQQVRADLSQRLQQFKSVNRYVTRNNKILPASQNRERYLRSKELVTEMGLYDLDDDTLFWEARSLAIEGKRDTARAIARVVLERNPGSHDVRTLLGRSYAWDQNYESAREQLREVIRRNPNYLDAYSALLDIALWNQNFEQAVSIADEGLAVDPQNTVFLQKKMQALEALEQPGAAQKAQDQLNNISGN